MQNIKLNELSNVCGGIGFAPRPPSQPRPATPHPTSASNQPTEAGNICRDLYSGVGAWIGGLLTTEFGAVGAIPGQVVGGRIGRAVCPP